MAAPLEQLVQTAERLATAGRWDDAEQAWQEVRRREPRHAKALFSLGVHALTRGDSAAALDLLRAARAEAPSDLVLLMTVCAAHNHSGDTAGELEAIDAALVVDPYFLPALLAKAGWLERQGLAAAAAATYANSLRIAPHEPAWPPKLRSQLLHAREVVEARAKAYGDWLATRLAEPMAGLPESLRGRWQEALSILAGLSRPYVSDSNQLTVPRLPAIPFYDRGTFDWIPELEAKTSVIRGELLALLATARDRFTPYIAYQPGQPVNQWQELNHSNRWSTLHLWRSGVAAPEIQERCPETVRALARVPMADLDGLCPNAMFSALAPHTKIPPHHGETNARLVVHLPLIVPERCRYRVGFEQRNWTVGEALVFDDTLEHEAANDSDELRVVLIFDVWNPLIEPAEREMVRAMSRAAREFANRGS